MNFGHFLKFNYYINFECRKTASVDAPDITRISSSETNLSKFWDVTDSDNTLSRSAYNLAISSNPVPATRSLGAIPKGEHYNYLL